MRFLITILVLTALSTAPPAAAFLEYVALPEAAEMGENVPVLCAGGLPDGCWVLLGVDISYDDLTAAVTISTRNPADPDVACIDAIVPYEIHPELTFDQAGRWSVQVKERAEHVGSGTTEYLWDGSILVTGETSNENSTWENIKAIYR